MALVNAMNSIILIQEELLSTTLPRGQDKTREANQNYEKEDNSKKKKSLEERLTILSIAYHNYAVELEYLGKYQNSLRAYQKASQFSEVHLGPSNPVSQNLKKVFEDAKPKIEERMTKKKKLPQEQKAKKPEKVVDKERKAFLTQNSGLNTNPPMPKEVTQSAKTMGRYPRKLSNHNPTNPKGLTHSTFPALPQTKTANTVTGSKNNGGGGQQTGGGEAEKKALHHQMEGNRSGSEIKEDRNESNSVHGRDRRQGWSEHVGDSRADYDEGNGEEMEDRGLH